MVGMKERPILFSAPMVRAILSGQKTMTRRVIKEFPTTGYRWGGWIIESSDRKETGAATVVPESNSQYCATGKIAKLCPYGQPGDRLWVRETWHCCETMQEYVKSGEISRDHIEYRADLPMVTICDGGWTPSIYMPRWASRINLEITAIRVERLNDISEEEAKAEGCELHTEYMPMKVGFNYRQAFGGLWESINGPGSWNANPWVWVVEFKKV